MNRPVRVPSDSSWTRSPGYARRTHGYSRPGEEKDAALPDFSARRSPGRVSGKSNTEQRTRLLVEGDVPILREKAIMTQQSADTPAKRIYLAVQLMYMSRDPTAHHQIYFELVRNILRAAPSTWQFVESINNHILTGELYKALKHAKKLIAYESELIENAKCGTSVREDSEQGRKSA